MIKDTKIGVKGMEVWKKSPLFHGMTEQKIEEILMQEQCRRKKYEKGTETAKDAAADRSAGNTAFVDSKYRFSGSYAPLFFTLLFPVSRENALCMPYPAQNTAAPSRNKAR